MPEDESISRPWVIDWCVLPQVQCLEFVTSLNGRKTVPKEVLVGCQILSYKKTGEKLIMLLYVVA